MSRPYGIFARVAGLALATLVLAQGVGFAVVGWWPAPPAPTMNPAQAIAALSGDAGVTPDLRVRTQADAPVGESVPWLVELAAHSLQRPASQIRAVWGQAPAVSLQIVESGRLSPAGPSARHQNHVHAALLVAGLRLPAFELAAAQPDGTWRIVGSSDPGRGQWRRQVLLALALGALLIAPITWWMARRLTLPLRRLADASRRMDLAAPAQALPIEGAREVRMLGQAIAEAHQRLRAQAEDVTVALAAVAHDLRTPLTGLRLRAESAPSPDRERMIADIERMQAMIVQVLAYAQGEVAPLQREPVDVASLVRELAASATAAGQQVQTRIDAAATVPGDALALRRAVSNLIDNGVRYAGAVEILLHVVDARLCIDVADRGPGIPAAARARLLQPFQRLEHSRNRDTGGAGLGLAVAHTVARRHGGVLELHDREDGGLIARLALPLAEP
ncbi:ATP-binding protein [Luteimonas sp. 3794]|uniref:sensor histidine kinase n=1 Tax=Luteimonas sp. 3794 TaxID=2817730 RepID=UPI00285A50CA|nr:ATP-binding protein [Luteimonas sp. 3794]MDR6990360.1 signal transduction histidine kinase [Luteimonas sp. 3794]